MQENNKNSALKHVLQIAHFGLIGVTATSVDLVVYHSAVHFGVATPISKSISFAFGLTVSYFGNANITFRRRIRKPIRFLVTYFCSLILNVFTNEVALNHIFAGLGNALTVSWLTATTISALFNFLFLKKWVFSGQVAVP